MISYYNKNSVRKIYCYLFNIILNLNLLIPLIAIRLLGDFLNIYNRFMSGSTFPTRIIKGMKKINLVNIKPPISLYKFRQCLSLQPETSYRYGTIGDCKKLLWVEPQITLEMSQVEGTIFMFTFKIFLILTKI